jgi:CRP-like cAMP-binding protein
MVQENMLTALASHDFLQGLKEPLLVELAECAQRVTIRAGQHLGRTREKADAFYLIEKGKVGIEIPRANESHLCIQTLGAGDIVGWSWLVPPHLWQFDARAVEPVQALELDARKLYSKCEADSELGYQLLKRLVKVISGRLGATRRELLEFRGRG